jgi:hypothetical protein
VDTQWAGPGHARGMAQIWHTGARSRARKTTPRAATCADGITVWLVLTAFARRGLGVRVPSSPPTLDLKEVAFSLVTGSRLGGVEVGASLTQSLRPIGSNSPSVPVHGGTRHTTAGHLGHLIQAGGQGGAEDDRDGENEGDHPDGAAEVWSPPPCLLG